MAKRISEWNSDDCLDFLKNTAKVTQRKITEGDVDVVCEAFRTNNIYGSSLVQLDDTDWNMLRMLSAKTDCRGMTGMLTNHNGVVGSGCNR